MRHFVALCECQSVFDGYLWYLMVVDASMHALCEYPSSFGMVALCYHNTRFCNRAKVRSPWISPENKAMFRSDRA